MTAVSHEVSLYIRPMELVDLEQVQVIDKLSFSLPWPASAYHYELNENPSSLLLVAEAVLPTGQKQVVGLIVAWFILDEIHIASIAVHPDYRGMGIGKRLLVPVIEDAIRKGSRLATLEVRAHNLVAQNLYHRFGFEVVGHRPRYYRDNNEDALIMTLNDMGEKYLEWLENGGWKDNVSSH